ncbi:hypothetical protein N8I77_009426 [Diaporthe amygdali]|uniref:Ubiquitin-like domain-containing protein n=1 Tax=Phomopsis amygdali TaxID=1214568 RepID=A0AAD9W2G1_PHOAM|nr:hypothetical protein N8I77_009426 [Diaporthe amygdali]
MGQLLLLIMAAPGFGFSVGDFIAGVSLVKKLIRALNDAAGSRAAYRKLIAELLNLDDALTEISKLQLGPSQTSQKTALQRVATQCQISIETFLQKNAKFNDSLGLSPSLSCSAWRSNLHKIQWALCRDTAIDELRTEIAAHTSTLNVILATIQVSATKLQEESLEDCTQMLQLVSDEAKKASDCAEQNQQTLVVNTGWLERISHTVTSLMAEQRPNGLLSLIQQVLQWNIKIFDGVTQTQQLLYNIPPQVELQQPVIFEDAHGRLSPFHVEFINSFAAFQAVLEARFEDMPGLNKVRSFEYAMQDTRSKKILDLNRPWENNFRPGRKFAMMEILIAVFSIAASQNSTSRHWAKEDGQSHLTIQQNERNMDLKNSILMRTIKERYIVHRESSSSTERVSTQDNTYIKCIKNIYYNVYIDGEEDVTERVNSCRPGHMCSNPIVREFDRKINCTRLQFTNPERPMTRRKVYDVHSQSLSLPTADKPISPLRSPSAVPYPPPLPPPRFVPVDGPQADHYEFVGQVRNDVLKETLKARFSGD